MALEINNPEIDKLLQELVEFTGESISQALQNSLKERLDRVKVRQQEPLSIQNELLRIGRECASLPVIDSRPADEILGYNTIGIPS